MTAIKTDEIGRSMVEILGVLVIIGTLSIGSFVGYEYAITKYQKNVIVDEINKRSIIGKNQFSLSIPINLSEFPTTLPTGHTIVLGTYSDKYFDIIVDNISYKVCSEIVKEQSNIYSFFIDGTKITSPEQCKKLTTLTFRFFENGIFSCPDILGVCQTSCDETTAQITLKPDGSICTNKDNKLGYCQNGVCVQDENTCQSNQDCTKENTYCQMTNPQDCMEEPEIGACVSIPNVKKEISYNGYKWKEMDYLNWWSGNNLCQAMGLSLPPNRGVYGSYTIQEDGEYKIDTSGLNQYYNNTLGWSWTAEESDVKWGCKCMYHVAVSHGGSYGSSKINSRGIFCVEKE